MIREKEDRGITEERRERELASESESVRKRQKLTCDVRGKSGEDPFAFDFVSLSISDFSTNASDRIEGAGALRSATSDCRLPLPSQDREGSPSILLNLHLLSQDLSRDFLTPVSWAFT